MNDELEVTEGWSPLPSAKSPASPGSTPRGAACRYRSAVRGARSQWPASASSHCTRRTTYTPLTAADDQPDGGRPRGLAYGHGRVRPCPWRELCIPRSPLRRCVAPSSPYALAGSWGADYTQQGCAFASECPCWRRRRPVNTNLKG